MNPILELLFPPKCMLCGMPLREDEEICSQCRQKVLLNTAPPRVEKGAFFDKAAAGLWYETDVRNAIQGLKYREKQNYARPLARVMVYAYQHKIGEECDLITFVPTNPSTLRRRGYDQAQLLAEALAEMLDLPWMSALEKTRETTPMHGLKVDARRANVLGAYHVCCQQELLKGKRVLLVDDILTTGSTLSECARMLKTAGAARVYGLCAAATRKSS